MHFPLLSDLLILLLFSVVVVFLLQRIKLPSILGFLITGIIIGPFGLSLIDAHKEIELISEIGVIMLLFVIGMELSIKQLISIRRTVFIGGSFQVLLSIGVAAAIAWFFGYSWHKAVFIGFLFSLSSTAIVLNLLQERNEINTAHGRNALGILIFQDIIVVPMMLLTPILAGKTANVGEELLSLAIKSVLVVVLALVSARYIVPRLMYAVVKTKNKELFLLTTITICFLVALVTAEAGLSLALGAFLAGLIISESDYSHQATSIILPFRELFTSFFFISVGMLLDLNFFISNAFTILALAACVLLVKSATVAAITRLLKYPPPTVILTGLSLFQIGEFAFILSKVGVENGLLTEATNQYFLAISIVTMLLTPFVFMYANSIASKFSAVLQKGQEPIPLPDMGEIEEQVDLDDHLIIIGYGVNGTNVARAAKYASIPYVIIELNPQTVKQEKAKGEPIIYGDATQDHLLETVRVNKARIVSIAISDPEATKYILSAIRTLSQRVYIIVRTRFVKEIEELLALGADEVIPEEYETSIEIFSKVMHNYMVPEDEIQLLIENIRANDYNLLINKKSARTSSRPTQIPDFKVTCIKVAADSGGIVGHTIEDADIRKNFGITVLAISRGDQLINHIQGDEIIQQHDLLYISGAQEGIRSFQQRVQ